MNKKLLKFLCCPACHHDLTLKDKQLYCIGCRAKYKIVNGVPVFIDSDKLDIHYQKQVGYFDQERKEREKYEVAPWQRSYLEKIEQHFGFKGKNKLIIDVGTGSGWAAVEMAKKDFNVIACDLAISSLIELNKNAARIQLSNKILSVCCTAENLPISQNIADYLISTAVLEHLPKEQEAIKEIDRVCKKNSKIFITVPLRYRYIWPIFWLINYIHDKRIGHLRRYDTEILLRKFYSFEFRMVKAYYTGHFLKTIGVLLSKLLRTTRFNKLWEEIDRRKEDKIYGANNISVIFKR